MIIFMKILQWFSKIKFIIAIKLDPCFVFRQYTILFLISFWQITFPNFNLPTIRVTGVNKRNVQCQVNAMPTPTHYHISYIIPSLSNHWPLAVHQVYTSHIAFSVAHERVLTLYEQRHEESQALRTKVHAIMQ